MVATILYNKSKYNNSSPLDTKSKLINKDITKHIITLMIARAQ